MKLKKTAVSVILTGASKNGKSLQNDLKKKKREYDLPGSGITEAKSLFTGINCLD